MTEVRQGPLEEAALARGWTLWNLKSLNDYAKAILELKSEERQKDRGASFGSIQNIFLHILEDYIWWFECIPQDKQEECISEPTFVGRDLTDKEFQEIVDRVNRSVHAVVDHLTPSDLGTIYVVNGIGGDGKQYTMTTSLADNIWHMLEEQLQHIGELNALFWQMDIDPPTHAWFSSDLAFAH